jgi:Terminase large subunit, T4likevirus-type, N-terminal
MASKDYVDPNWRGTYNSLQEFYKDNYDSNYYTFNPQELTIDPMETMDQIEAYDQRRRNIETIKCATDFNYFCHKYVKIVHPKRGLLPFITYTYQRKVIKEYNNNRFCIISKFRQGGLTTVTVLWALWRCLFCQNETIMVVSKTDREAIAAGEIVKRAMAELPSWMKPEMTKDNDHQKFFGDTGCKLFFYPPDAARGRSMSYLIVDEAAFIPGMVEFWNAILPTIATGGNVIVVSTVNGVSGLGGWYHDTYKAAESKENDFHIIDIDYWEHPDYNEPSWVNLMKNQLGEKGWKQEVLRDFMGGGNSFIPADILRALEKTTSDPDMGPMRILFEEWRNKPANTKNADKNDKGALYIWREPIPGREYILGFDVAAGMGDDKDNSVFEVIDAVTCEQVAEFYSNLVPAHVFAQVVAQTATIFNTALVIGEEDKWGKAVLDKLVQDLGYENMFYSVSGGNEKLGVTPTKKSRPAIIELLQARLLTSSVPIRSRRLVYELKNFVYNDTTKTPQADKGYHDDAIVAFSYALYGRENSQRYLPVGAILEAPNELSERYKMEVFEEIKAELAKNAPEDWFQTSTDDDDPLDIDFDEYHYPGIRNKIKRSSNKLLSDFGW